MQRNSFTLNQLQYASEICFFDRFVEIFNRFAEGTEYHGLGIVYALDNKSRKRTLIDWIFVFSRADRDDEFGTIIDSILTELIGDYEKS